MAPRGAGAERGRPGGPHPLRRHHARTGESHAKRGEGAAAQRRTRRRGKPKRRSAPTCSPSRSPAWRCMRSSAGGGPTPLQRLPWFPSSCVRDVTACAGDCRAPTLVAAAAETLPDVGSARGARRRSVSAGGGGSPFPRSTRGRLPRIPAWCPRDAARGGGPLRPTRIRTGMWWRCGFASLAVRAPCPVERRHWGSRSGAAAAREARGWRRRYREARGERAGRSANSRSAVSVSRKYLTLMV